MGKKFEEVKENQYKCKLFEHKDIDKVIESMNNFLAEPLDKEKTYRFFPIDMSLSIKVIPELRHYKENCTLKNDIVHSVLLIYEIVNSVQ